MGASRRRQRSVRTTLAAALLAGAAVVVVPAVASGRMTGPAAVLALVGGVAVARILSTELAQSRRDAARERAGLAWDYQRLAAHRAGEHARLSAGLATAVAERELVIARLRRTLGLVQARLDAAEQRLALGDPVTDPDELAIWDAAQEAAPATASAG